MFVAIALRVALVWLPVLDAAGGTGGDLAPSSARALPAVSFDWSRVPDSFVRRCHLGGLENLALQVLISDGYAVMADPGPDGVRIILEESNDALRVSGRWRDGVRETKIAVPKACESTFAVEIIHAVTSLLATVQADRRAPSLPTSTMSTMPPAGPTSSPRAIAAGTASLAAAKPAASSASAAESDTHLQTGGPSANDAEAGAGQGGRGRTPSTHTGLGVSSSAEGTVLAMLAAVIDWSLPARLQAGARLELGVGRRREMWVFEPLLAARAGRLVAEAGGVTFRAGVEAGALAHLVYLDSQSKAARFIARVGLPIEARHGPSHLGLTLIPYVRLSSVRDRVDGRLAYQASYLGAVCEISWTMQ